MASPRRRRPPKPNDAYRYEAEQGKGENWAGYRFRELVGLACEYFANGCPPARLRDLLSDGVPPDKLDNPESSQGTRPAIHIHRELPYHLLGYALTHKLLKYSPPTEDVLRDRIKEAWPLTVVEPVYTGSFEGIAPRAAQEIISILRSFRKPEVHLGFAGGYSVQRTAQALADRLQEGGEFGDLRKIIIHTMIAGFDDDPTVDPLSFCTYFRDRRILIDFEFVVLRAPAFATTAGELDQTGHIKEARERARELDLIVTGAAQWEDEDHSILKNFLLKKNPHGYEQLKGKVIGDLLSSPIGPDGPIEELRAITLKDLRELPDFIKSGKRVLLVCGPCGRCNKTKTGILRKALELGYLSDLIVDSRTARELVS